MSNRKWLLKTEPCFCLFFLFLSHSWLLQQRSNSIRTKPNLLLLLLFHFITEIFLCVESFIITPTLNLCCVITLLLGKFFGSIIIVNLSCDDIVCSYIIEHRLFLFLYVAVFGCSDNITKVRLVSLSWPTSFQRSKLVIITEHPLFLFYWCSDVRIKHYYHRGPLIFCKLTTCLQKSKLVTNGKLVCAFLLHSRKQVYNFCFA